MYNSPLKSERQIVEIQAYSNKISITNYWLSFSIFENSLTSKRLSFTGGIGVRSLVPARNALDLLSIRTSGTAAYFSRTSSAITNIPCDVRRSRSRSLANTDCEILSGVENWQANARGSSSRLSRRSRFSARSRHSQNDPEWFQRL